VDETLNQERFHLPEETRSWYVWHIYAV